MRVWWNRLRSSGLCLNVNSAVLILYEIVDTDVHEVADLDEVCDVRVDLAGFPLGNGLAGDADLFGDRFLGQAAGFPEMDQVFAEHGVPPSYARSAFIRERKAREEKRKKKT